MFIKQIEIERFRCVLFETLECDSLTALVGRNGAGKSCFLHALGLFYAVSPIVSDEDFYNRQTGEPIQIRVTFNHLLPEEADIFRPYLDGQELIVTKRISYADGKVLSKTYGASLQLPEFAEVRANTGRLALKEAFNALVDAGTLSGLARATSAPDAETKMAEWEAANHGACKPIEREAQFIGPASIGVGLLDSFTKFVFIPAVRDVTDEAGDGKGSALAALLDLVVNERVEDRPDLQALREHIKTAYADIFAPGDQPELVTLAAEISLVLGDFHPGASVELGWRADSPPELGLPSVNPMLIEDGFKGHVSRKGHGLQRALVLALLQARAKTTAPVPAAPDDALPIEPAAVEVAPRRNLILVIEEPELYQHPQQCRHWAKVLRRITKPPTGRSVSDTQVIFTTHSPHFVDLSWFNQVRVVRKVAAEQGLPPVTTTRQTTLDLVAQELAAGADRLVAEFTQRTMQARARPVMTNLVNEGFFATVVVLVEGGTEVGLLHEVARRMDMDWDAKGIAVIDVGGKTKLDRPLVVFRKMDIPTYVVFDADAHKPNDDHKKHNRRLLRLLSAAEVDYPDEASHPLYTVIGKETTRHLKTSLGDADFARLAESVRSDLGYSDVNRAMKNVEATAMFAALVYDEGKQLPLFESIVNCVTALAPDLA